MTETTLRSTSNETATAGDEPRPGAADERLPETDPEIGIAAPGTVSAAPGTVSPAPGTGSAKPGTGFTDPGTGFTDPGTGSAVPPYRPTEPIGEADETSAPIGHKRRDPPDDRSGPLGRGAEVTNVSRRSPPYWIAWLILAVLVLGGLSWLAQNRIARIERDVARRVQALESMGAQRDDQIRLAQDLVRDAQARVGLLEGKLAESVGQQAQLRQLYDEMARSRGDRMLADVENSILLASQQLQMTGSIQGALLALQDADQALARSSQPALIGLRRLLTRDMERLKALPMADFPTLVARLDAVIAAVDQLPMLSEVQAFGPAGAAASPALRPGAITPAGAVPPIARDVTQPQAPAGVQPGVAVGVQPAAPVGVQPSAPVGVQPGAPVDAQAGDPPATPPVAPATAQPVAPLAVQPDASGAAEPTARLFALPGWTTLTGWSDRVVRTGQQGWDAFVAEFRQLVRVQRVDQADALLLAPDQRYFARENLRLLLLHARLNLLARNEPLLRSDLARATQAIETYFDRDSRAVASTLVTLRQLQAARLAVELPSLSDSIGAVRAARAASETAGR